jgi:hypothetical protein
MPGRRRPLRAGSWHIAHSWYAAAWDPKQCPGAPVCAHLHCAAPHSCTHNCCPQPPAHATTHPRNQTLTPATPKPYEATKPRKKTLETPTHLVIAIPARVEQHLLVAVLSRVQDIVTATNGKPSPIHQNRDLSRERGYTRKRSDQAEVSDKSAYHSRQNFMVLMVADWDFTRSLR